MWSSYACEYLLLQQLINSFSIINDLERVFKSMKSQEAEQAFENVMLAGCSCSLLFLYGLGGQSVGRCGPQLRTGPATIYWICL